MDIRKAQTRHILRRAWYCPYTFMVKPAPNAQLQQCIEFAHEILVRGTSSSEKLSK